MSFYEDINKCWLHQLDREINKIKYDIHEHLKHNINVPLINISDSRSILGYWDAENNTISISIRLLRECDWDKVVHVLRHEFAHLIVSRIFKMDDTGHSHGEAFKKACDVLKVPADRLISIGEKNGEICEKIKKLMIKGNCHSICKEESDLFLNKARQIMVKYNIDSIEDMKVSDGWVGRPIGSLHNNKPCYISDLGKIVEKFYFVKSIWKWAWVKENGKTQARHYLEIFGNKENVDVAEYICHALLTNSDMLWKEFLNKEKERLGIKDLRRHYSKHEFVSGLLKGYYKQLEEFDTISVTPEQNKMIHVSDPILQEMYQKRYPNMRYVTKRYRIGGAGYDSGFNCGKNLKISRAVGQPSENRQLCLN